MRRAPGCLFIPAITESGLQKGLMPVCGVCVRVRVCNTGSGGEQGCLWGSGGKSKEGGLLLIGLLPHGLNINHVSSQESY